MKGGEDDTAPLLSESGARPAAAPAPKERHWALYAFGLFLIGCVVVQWIASGVIAQEIYKEMNCAAFLSANASAGFAGYLIIYAIQQGVYACLCPSKRSRLAPTPAALSINGRASGSAINGDSFSSDDGADAPRGLAMGATAQPHRPQQPDAHGDGLLAADTAALRIRRSAASAASTSDTNRADAVTTAAAVEGDGDNEAPMPWREHARVGFLIAPAWLSMNFFWTLSLSLTSLASNTVLSTTTSLWVMLSSAAFLGAPLRLQQAIAVVFTLTGAVLVATHAPAPAEGADAGPVHSLLGDGFVLIGAFSTAFYSLFVDTLLGDVPSGAAPADNPGAGAATEIAAEAVAEAAYLADRRLHPQTTAAAGGGSGVTALVDEGCFARARRRLAPRPRAPGRVNMFLVFGFMGVGALCLSTPLAVILHFTGVQVLTMPSPHTLKYVACFSCHLSSAKLRFLLISRADVYLSSS
jgi:hypothetical protein